MFVPVAISVYSLALAGGGCLNKFEGLGADCCPKRVGPLQPPSRVMAQSCPAELRAGR